MIWPILVQPLKQKEVTKFMKKIIFGFVGKLASGKTKSCNYLVENYQAQTFAFSGPLRDVLKRLYLPDTRDNLQKTSQALREFLGQDVLAKVLAEDAKNSSAKIVVIDGVRRPKDIEYLKLLDNFFLINVEADQQLRYERIIKRGQNSGETELTFEQFKKDESAEAESLIDEVADQAKFNVTNNGTEAELLQKIDNVLIKINTD